MSANLQSSQVITPPLPPSSLDSEFTGLQLRFIEAYCAGPTRFNATRSAEAAGYQGDYNTLGQTGFQLLKLPKIKAEINERLDALSMSPSEITWELSDVARANWRDEADNISAGEKVKALAELAKIRKLYDAAPVTNDGSATMRAVVEAIAAREKCNLALTVERLLSTPGIQGTPAEAGLRALIESGAGYNANVSGATE